MRCGIYIWRYTDGRDALIQDVIGPSSYRKGQSSPVRVWGVLADGILHVEILPPGETWNAEVYSDLVDTHFEKWVGTCVSDGHSENPNKQQA